jgi:hypothetical protein
VRERIGTSSCLSKAKCASLHAVAICNDATVFFSETIVHLFCLKGLRDCGAQVRKLSSDSIPCCACAYGYACPRAKLGAGQTACLLHAGVGRPGGRPACRIHHGMCILAVRAAPRGRFADLQESALETATACSDADHLPGQQRVAAFQWRRITSAAQQFHDCYAGGRLASRDAPLRSHPACGSGFPVYCKLQLHRFMIVSSQ